MHNNNNSMQIDIQSISLPYECVCVSSRVASIGRRVKTEWWLFATAININKHNTEVIVEMKREKEWKKWDRVE